MIDKLKILYIILIIYSCDTKVSDPEKQQFCNEVKDCESLGGEVCGIRWDGKQHVVRIFSDECELLKYGCEVEHDDEAYGIINMEFCGNYSLAQQLETTTRKPSTHIDATSSCVKICPAQTDNKTVCAMRAHGLGFKLRLFINRCELMKYNCENNATFNITDDFLCDGLEVSKAEIINKNNVELDEPEFTVKDEGHVSKDATRREAENEKNDDTTNDFNSETFDHNGIPLEESREKTKKRLVVVDAGMFDNGGSINDTIDNFFTATHVYDMPLRQVDEDTFNVSTRRKFVKLFGPVLIYKPIVTIPKNVSEDYWHKPTLGSCYHQCPKECPDEYAPVCGVPGREAREPAITFRNHCFMDAAQCKLRWNNASSTANRIIYMENSFVFCLGDTLNGLYRFLPMMRTLQHMGRLKLKGKYKIRLRNMRFFNELLSFRPQLMG